MPNNPNHLENLKPFKKGHDERRNMDGAPKLPEIKELMQMVLGGDSDGVTSAFKILDINRKKAEKGDLRAAEFLFNRGYGLPNQKVQHSGDPESPVIFKLDDRFKDS